MRSESHENADTKGGKQAQKGRGEKAMHPGVAVLLMSPVPQLLRNSVSSVKLLFLSVLFRSPLFACISPSAFLLLATW